MMRKAAKEEHHYMEDDEKDFESKDPLQYGNLTQELIDLLRHHARVCGNKENSPLSEVNVNGYLTPICRMREDWPYAKWTFYVENVMKAYSGLLRRRYMETWAKQRFPVDKPDFAQEEEGKILTVQACYFLAYHIVKALSPAKEVVMDIEPRLQFVFLPHYWFKNLWLEIGLAVAGGKEHYEKRPPTGLVKAAPAPQQKDGVLVTQNDVERIEVFLPIWMVPPIYKHHNDLKMSGPSGSQERFDVTLDKMHKPYRLEGPAMHVQWNLQMPIDYVNFPLLKEAALRGVLGHATWHCRKKEVKVKSQIFLPAAGEAFRHSLGRLTRDAFPQYWPLTTSQALAHLDMYKTVTMASMKEIFTQLPHNDIAIRLHAPASLAMASAFCFLKPTAGSRRDFEEKWNAVEVPSWLHGRAEMNSHRKEIEALASTAKPLDPLKIPEEVLQWEEEALEDSSDEEKEEEQEKVVDEPAQAVSLDN